MKLNLAFYDNVRSIEWFSRCGTPADGSTDIRFVQLQEQALLLLSSPQWADVRTEAQGDLTGYLAKHHYASYGGHWNNLAKESLAHLEELHLLIYEAMTKAGLPDVSKSVLLDINRAALENAYATVFPKVPRFFTRLLEIYRVGRLPCGWTEPLKAWPRGCVIAY
jgi:hypothetical protein